MESKKPTKKVRFRSKNSVLDVWFYFCQEVLIEEKSEEIEEASDDEGEIEDPEEIKDNTEIEFSKVTLENVFFVKND